MNKKEHNNQESLPENPQQGEEGEASAKNLGTTPSVTTVDVLGKTKTIAEQVNTIRSFGDLAAFDAYIKELSASQENVSKVMSVLLPGHESTCNLVQAVWESLYAHFQAEQWKLSDFSSLSSTMQRLTSMQNQFDALEMRRLEFARDHKELTQFSHKAMDAIREHADMLSPEVLEQIEVAINIL